MKLGIPAVIVGIILLVARIWDAVNDPVFSLFVEKIKLKGGKFKPWINASVILMPVSTVLIFSFTEALISAALPVKIIYACENAALGVEACLWSERVDTEQKLEMQVFPRVFALAEIAWSHVKDYRDFEKRLKHKLRCLKESDISYTEKYNPSHLEKLAGLKSFAAGFSQTTENRDENKLDISEIFDGEKLAAFLVGFGIEPGLIKAFGGLFGNKQE